MSSHEEYEHLKISLKEIREATNDFADENLIGRGGFGKVYKGNLMLAGQQTDIVARMLHYDYGQGDLEFWTEIMTLSGLKHRNLVSFVGYCDEKGKKIIINKHESHESLDKYLKGSVLTWLQRLKICVGIARAMNYIHYDAGRNYSVIHRNIKSSKVLLDDNWEPKLSGFEHAVRNTTERRHRLLLAEIIGTIGYVDPTYEKTGFVTHKSDVYSFGVVLFEIMCGRKAFISVEQEHRSFQLAKTDYKEGKADVDNCLSPSPSTDKQPSSFTNARPPPPTNKIPKFGDWDDWSFHDGQPHSFVDGQPSSFGLAGPSSAKSDKQSSPPVPATTQPLSPTNVKKSWFTRVWLSLSNCIRSSQSTDIEPSKITKARPSLLSTAQLSSLSTDEQINRIRSPHRATSLTEIKNTYKPTSSPANTILRKSYSSKEQGFALQPLFTMKRLDQYLHTPYQDLLAQLAKSHYDEENLDDIIDPALREQMDPESFKIFSETAYNCLKEQRAQRPNIDQILRNLENALKYQMKQENLEHPIVTSGEVQGTSSNRWKGENLEHLKIPLTDIVLATKNFTKRYLGSGTYGKVYRAELELPIEDKGELSRKWRTVAIKCIRDNKHGKEGFIAEIKLLTSCKHDNIVPLLGFCDEGKEMILVYEHASNGSLDNYLGNTSNSTNLTWVQRIKICVDVARGLNYLHTRVEDEQRIVHRDIKSGNILLGKNWVAKIADFGLSRFHHNSEQSKSLYTEKIAGTKEYLCPEYMKTGRLKKAIDIYSFGVVLFEILFGKLANDPIYTAEDEYGIGQVALRRFEEKTIHEMVDPKIMEEVDELASTLHKGPNQDSLRTFLEIAYRCVAITQDERPLANDILEELQKALSFQENNKDTLQMSFEEIKLATQNFHRENMIGGGGFGRVFKGEVIRGNQLTIVVAKRLDRSQGQGEHHFLTELEILFEYKHENIIGLEGYCNENDEKIIVYEHASNRSLDMHLNDVSLTWSKRLKICIDVARGLAFLHGGAPTKEMVIHRDIKSANILLNADWNAKISDFGLSAITAIDQEVIGKLVGTIGYVDPVYEISGFFTEKSDIYSLGVVLTEILSGQLLVPSAKDYDQQHVRTILKHVHEEGKLGLIVFDGIKEQIALESLSAFQAIASQCLDSVRKKRPRAEEVLQQLIKALEFQEDYEIWGPKLPKDYEEIIKLSKSSGVYYTTKKKDLYNMFSKGILLQDDKVLFSLGGSGGRNEMISSTKFSYINRSLHTWKVVQESRFKKVAEMLDISNLMIKIKTRPQLLSQVTVYGVHLVFKFSDSRKFSTKPMYVNLKYTKESETLYAYFATWRDNDWMMIELWRFLNNKEDPGFKFILESFSPYDCGDCPIYVEGLEFRAIDDASCKRTLFSILVLFPLLDIL
ncbi:uncharacterized protein LOC143609052 [Bidens hawaiensis]|uniref:uncharacterized protein LOC143609052 n=1 Tax=Bidens hawaiensis TaxID=980011 RepID=UPI00404AC634